MNPSEFVQLAAKIVAFGPSGARSAISRAYYGVFHECRAVLISLGAQPPGSGASHAIVPNYFQLTSHADAQAIGSDLNDLHSDRIRAAFHLSDKTYEELGTAQNCVIIAQNILRLLEQYQQRCLADDATRQDLLQAVAKVDAVRQVRK